MISDLLAQISGEADGAGKPPSPSQPPKRKASHELAREPMSKTPRTTETARPVSRNDTKPRVAPPTTSQDRNGATPISRPPAANAGLRQTETTSKPTVPLPGKLSNGNGATRAAGTVIKGISRNAPINSSNNRDGLKTATTTPATTSASTTPATSKPPPKKGSFLEIMERAKANQAKMAQLGKIQHKPLDRLPTKRERMLEAKGRGEKADRTGKLTTSKTGPSTRPLNKGTAIGGQRGGKSGDGGENGSTAVRRKSTVTSKEEEKAPRPKKAATATTGYQGTARPRHPVPSASTSTSSPIASKPGSRAAGSVRMPFGDPRRRTSSRRDDDYDDDLDDFIEYDDDDEDAALEVSAALDRRPGASRWRYAASSDDDDAMEEEESDMEAGLSDIDEEEKRAERQARLEDAEQEALERRLKLQKEARKQQLLAGRAGKGSR